MKPIRTVSDYVNMSSGDMKRFMKSVARKAAEEQRSLEEKYEKAVKNGDIQPV